MYIFEIIPGTLQHAKMERIFNWTTQFNNPEFQAEFKQKIGVEQIDNCSTNTSQLLLEHTPEGTREQFHKELRVGKNCMFYAAKVKSALNKTYLELIKKYGIEEHRMIDFTFSYLHFNTSRYISQVGRAFERYFLEVKRDCPASFLAEFRGMEFLKEISESEYLRARAEYMESVERQEREKKTEKKEAS